MVRVKFRTNLGLHMATSLGLDSTKCTYESEVDVSKEAAESLVASGIAVRVAAAARTVKAVPDAPEIADSPPAEIAGEESVPETKSKKKS